MESRICASVDLAPYFVSAPVSAPSGGDVTVSMGISNNGNSASGGYYVNVYASSDRNITASDILLKTDWRPSINSYSSQSWSESVTFPSWLTGNYFLGVIADPWGYVAETNKANNATAASNATSVSTPAQIDLVPYFVSAPTTALAGSTVTVSMGISNNGNTASGGYYVDVYASNSPYITTSRICLKTDWRPSINGYSSQSWSESVTLPSWLTGNYYLGVIADPWGYVIETNKGNNAMTAWNATTVFTPAQIDLAPFAVSAPASTAVGSTVNVSIGICNNGSTASGGYYINVYASSDSNITTSDTLLKTDWRPSINGYTSQYWTESVSLPSPLFGTCYIGVIADPWGSISETNKSNNSLAAFSTTTIGATVQNPYYSDFLNATVTAGVPSSWASNSALLNLVSHESSWNPYAQNPTSTAYGLFQLLDKTWAAVGVTKTSNPYWQAVAGFRYISNVYQTPERAWAFWQATVYRNTNLAPSDLVWKAQYWIANGLAGY